MADRIWDFASTGTKVVVPLVEASGATSNLSSHSRLRSDLSHGRSAQLGT